VLRLATSLGIVVAEVGGDDGAGADEVVLLVEDEASPGELTWAGQPVGQALYRRVPRPVGRCRQFLCR